MASAEMQRPSNLELFVCQRVSAELQPLLDSWRDAVRGELLSVREATADAADWREAVSAELAELRGEQQRAAASLTTTASQLAEAPPVRIQKKLEKQQETLSDSLRQLQDELKETRKTFDRAEAAAAKERRELLKTAQEEKAAALSASALERSHAEQRVAELEATLQRSESAARAASARASQGEESSLSLTKALGEVRVLVAQNEGVEAARAAAVERLEELTQVNRAADAVVMQQAVHCTLLSEAVLEAERDDNVREKAALEHAHTQAAALAQQANAREQRRERAHAEWLAATEAVVPTIATAASDLVGRLEGALDRADFIEGWRGRAIKAEADAEAAEALRKIAEARAVDAEREAKVQQAEAHHLSVHVRSLIVLLGELERDAALLAQREAAAMHAVSEMEVAVSELAPLHEAITSLGSEVLLPMRTLELDAAQTASRYAESLAEANARAISEQSASRAAFSAAEQAWREERVATHKGRDLATADAKKQASKVVPLEEELSKTVTRCAVLEERIVSLEKELQSARDAVPIADNAAKEAISALRLEVSREREVAENERRAHAAERSELAGQVERARIAAATGAEESANAVQKAAEESRADLALEREASIAREAVAIASADEARAVLERYRVDAVALQRKMQEAHSHELAAANARVAERAAVFESEMAKQRERSEVLVMEAKAAAAAMHESAIRAAAEATAAAEAKVEAAQQASRAASEHNQLQMRSLAREHAASLRAERQLAAQELAAARERAEDAERRLESVRHGERLDAQLSPAKLSRSSSPRRASAGRPTGGVGVEEEEQDEWEGIRRQQEAVSVAHAQRLAEMGAPATTIGRPLAGSPYAARASPAPTPSLSTLGGASAALLRRAMLSEGRPQL